MKRVEIPPRLSLYLEPIDDESGFGLLTRTAWRLGRSDLSSLFDLIKPYVPTEYEYPSRIAQTSMLVAWASRHLAVGVDEVLDRFSNLAFFRPFLAFPFSSMRLTGDAPRLRKWDRFDRGWWSPLGLQPREARYCPECTRAQYDEYGDTTWLRSHNIAGVTVCHRHGCWLDREEFNWSALRLPPRERGVMRAGATSRPDRDSSTHANFAKLILEARLPWIPPWLRQSIFRDRLDELEKNHGGPLLQLRADVRSFELQDSMYPGFKPVRRVNCLVQMVKSLFEDQRVFVERVRRAFANVETLAATPSAVEAGFAWFDVRPRQDESHP